MEKDEWLTIQAAAKYLSLSVPTIRNYLKSGKLTTYRNGRTIRLKRVDLDSIFKKT